MACNVPFYLWAGCFIFCLASNCLYIPYFLCYMVPWQLYYISKQHNIYINNDVNKQKNLHICWAVWVVLPYFGYPMNMSYTLTFNRSDDYCIFQIQLKISGFWQIIINFTVSVYDFNTHMAKSMLTFAVTWQFARS